MSKKLQGKAALITGAARRIGRETALTLADQGLNIIIHFNRSDTEARHEMRLPDPDILKRAFLAIPLYELAPALILPGYGLPIRDIAQLFASADMEPLQKYTRELQDELLGS